MKKFLATISVLFLVSLQNVKGEESGGVVIGCSSGGNNAYNVQYDRASKSLRVSTWSGLETDGVHSQVYSITSYSPANVTFTTRFARLSSLSESIPTSFSFAPALLDTIQNSKRGVVTAVTFTNDGRSGTLKLDCEFYEAGVGPGA